MTIYSAVPWQIVVELIHRIGGYDINERKYAGNTTRKQISSLWKTYPHKLLKNSSQLSIFNDNRLIMRENWRGLFLKERQASNAQKSLKWLSRKNTQITRQNKSLNESWIVTSCRNQNWIHQTKQKTQRCPKPLSLPKKKLVMQILFSLYRKAEDKLYWIKLYTI